MRFLESLTQRLPKWGAFLSSLLMMALVVLILTEIISRSFFDTSTMLADEYSGYFYLALVFFGLAYTLNEEAHIRISIISSRLQKRSRKILDLIIAALSFAVMAFVAYYCYLMMIDVKEMEMLSENVSETPLYLTQIPMPIGIVLFMLALLGFFMKRSNDDI